MKSKQVHYLIYRVDTEYVLKSTIDWTLPTGGLVIDRIDKPHAESIALQRYHVAPYEELLLAEVWGDAEVVWAESLHRKWDREMAEFPELMTQTRE